MPTITGTSIKGYQRLTGAVPLSVARFDLAITASPTSDAERLGYGYVLGGPTTTPFQRFVVADCRVYRPGRVFLWLPLSNSPAWNWRVDVDWNVAGVAWSLTYN